MTDLDQYCKFAMDLARQSGTIIRDALDKDKKVDLKLGPADLVTETDQFVENFILDAIKTKYPSHKFIGEESYCGERKPEWSADPTWIVDPIDGTTNFIYSIPFVAVSIGLTINKQVVVGVVYNVILDIMYTGILGKGSTANGRPLKMSPCPEISSMMFATEVGSTREEAIVASKMNTMHRVASKCRGMRCFGSAALNCALVAAGRIDLYYEYGVHCWDVAAAVVIVTEAGGHVSDPSGKPFDLMSRGILVSSSLDLMPAVSALIDPIYFEPDA